MKRKALNLKALTILSALLLFLSLPALAQMSDEPMQDQSNPAVQTEQQTDTQQADSQDGEQAGVETSASAELQADDDQGVSADAEASAEVNASDDTSAEDTGSESEENLPQTASPLALLALLGSAGAGSAFGLRRLRK